MKRTYLCKLESDGPCSIPRALEKILDMTDCFPQLLGRLSSRLAVCYDNNLDRLVKPSVLDRSINVRVQDFTLQH